MGTTSVKKTIKAVKPAVKKVAKKAAKTTATTSRGNTYVITASGKKALTDISGQGALIRDCIAQHGPITSKNIVERIGAKLGTENPAKNIAFYLCTWKSDGFLTFGPKPKK